jgi:hypothetical protein
MMASIVNSLLRYVTRFPCETFGWYVAVVYRKYQTFIAATIEAEAESCFIF